MSEGMYILIAMVVLFGGIYIYSYHFSDLGEKRKQKLKEMREKEKEERLKKLREEHMAKRAEIEDRYRESRERSEKVRKAMQRHNEWKAQTGH